MGVTGGNGTVLVERDADRVLVAEMAPRVLAMLRAGLDGDRDGVRRAALRLREDLAGERVAPGMGRRAVEAFLSDLDTTLADVDRRLCDAAGAARRPDILATLHRQGSLTDAELAAGMELRRVAEVEAVNAGGACRAIDPRRPYVDGGRAEGGMPAGMEMVHHPAYPRMVAWARAAGTLVKGKGGSATAAELTLRVVAGGEPLGEADGRLRVKKGTSSRVVKASLRLYVEMHRTSIAGA